MNKILIEIYNHTMNASTPIDFQQYLTWDETFNPTVSSNVSLLYISLGVSITEAAFALIIIVWLTRYQRSLTGTGPTIHERIRQRHEAYTGLMEWKLPVLIEILPMVALGALALFAAFIRHVLCFLHSQWHSYLHFQSSDFIWGAHPMTGITLNNIFIAAALFFVLTASFAAFIPGAPFHSPLSGFFRLIFQMFPNRSINGLIRIRTICVTLIFIISLVLFFNTNPPWAISALLQFLLPVSLLSLCQRTQDENESQEQPKPRLFSLATCLYSLFTVSIALSVTIQRVPPNLFYIFYILSGLTLVIMTMVAMQMAQGAPDEGRAKAEAVAWMIKARPSHDLVMFRNAIEVAKNHVHLRSMLLEEILPVLDVVIKSIPGDREEDLMDEEKIYVALLAVLVDFEPCKASFWRNEAAMKRPDLSCGLKEKLRILRKGCDGHSSTPLSGCIKFEAEFILGKVGVVDGPQKESTWVESQVV